MWLGDSAYFGPIVELPLLSPFYDVTDAEVKREFEHTKQNPSYQRLLASKTQIIGVWDDHDFGVNDGDKTLKGKVRVRKHFLDFVDEPQ